MTNPLLDRYTLLAILDDENRLVDDVEKQELQSLKSQIEAEHEIVEKMKARISVLELLILTYNNAKLKVLRLIKDDEVMSKELLSKIDSCGRIEEEMTPLKKELAYIQSILEGKA